MKREGPHQDMLYLGFALAAVMCAAAVILAARAMKSRPQPKPEAKTASRAEAKKSASKHPAKRAHPAAEAVPSPSTHDPFTSLVPDPRKAGARDAERSPARPRASGSSRTRPGANPRGTRAAPDDGLDADLQLLGILRSSDTIAVLRLDDDRHYVHVGEKVGDFKLVKIEARTVVVSRDGKTFTLAMHQDKAERARAPALRRPRPARRSYG